MEIVSGCVIKRNNKILMVKEAKKICYGKWNFPAGHVDEKEGSCARNAQKEEQKIIYLRK